MKNTRFLVSLLLLAFATFACKNDAAAGKDATTATDGASGSTASPNGIPAPALSGTAKGEQYAVEMCGCLQPVLNITKKAQALIAAGNKAEADKLRPEMEAVKASTGKCGQAVEAKYGKLTTAEGKASMAALQRSCPDVSNFLRAMMQMQRQNQPVH